MSLKEVVFLISMFALAVFLQSLSDPVPCCCNQHTSDAWTKRI
jgi:hypothetical protein